MVKIKQGSWLVVMMFCACSVQVGLPPPMVEATPVVRLRLTTAVVEQGGDVVVTRVRGDAPLTQERYPVAAGTQTLEVPHQATEDLHLVQRGADRQALASTIQQGGCPQGQVPQTSEVLRVPEGFATIQAAIDAAHPGDTVLVGPGVWTESVRLTSGLTLRGSGAGQTVLDAQGAPRTLVDFTGAQDVTVSGFTFRGVSLAATCGRDVLGCSGNWYAAAIYADGHEASEPGNVPDSGTVGPTTCAGSSAHITHNVFEKNAIAIMPYFHALAIVENNLFVDNDNAYVANHLQDPGVVMNNTFYGSSQNSLSISAGFVDVVNNVIAKSLSSAMYQEHVQRGRVRANLVFGRDAALPLAMTIGEDGNLEADPLLVDPTTHDFHLAPGSPAIDTGWDAGGSLTDADGSPPDMGAWGGPMGRW